MLGEGVRLYEHFELEAAWQHFERALRQARQEQDQRTKAEAHLGLGRILNCRARYPAAREHLQKALALFQALSDRPAVARVSSELGVVALAMGNRERASGLHRNALAEFEAAGDEASSIEEIYNLLKTILPWGEEERQLAARTLERARRLGNRRLEGMLLHVRADAHFIGGDSAASVGKLERAAKLLQESGARRELARVLTSLGRLHRFHGRPEQALEFYGRALRLQEETGDQFGLIQTINAQAVAHCAMAEHAKALDGYKRVVKLARETGSPGAISFYLSNLGSEYLDVGQYARGAEVLEQALAESRWSRQGLYFELGRAYLGLRRYTEALDASEKAVELARTSGLRELLPGALHRRAIAKQGLGRPAEALADAREALRAFEQLRANLVPTDFMKRGFAGQYRDVFAYMVELLHEAARHEEALEVAERGRARAFLDLLATRDIDSGRTGRTQLAALRQVERKLQAEGIDPAQLSSAPSLPLVLRGAAPEAVSLWTKWQDAEPELRSLVSAPSFSAIEMSAAAARLRSTLLAYWVGPEATYVWVVRPGRPVRAARVEVSAERLRRLIAESSMMFGGGRVSATRGGESIYVDQRLKDAWRRLYQLLIRPVRPWLPGTRGARLTVVPHGPLFQVSFAALLGERGRYLVEQYELHYVPAAAVLGFTEKKKRQAAGRPPRYLLVADPAGMAGSPGGDPLPRLPGSRREVKAIARLALADSVTLLEGSAAREETLRALASEHTVIHFATHAVVRDDQPLDSFLALSGEQRLTAQKIYGLDLAAADLVVLSACRSALGKISGDGIVGLTRAFFYAGAPSVVATLWEVPDEPTHRLVSELYQSLHRLRDKSRALRTAQLRMLGALRRGEVKVETPAGTFALPEHPVFWAGFVLQGEP